MVFRTCAQFAKRVPLIKFRKGGSAVAPAGRAPAAPAIGAGVAPSASVVAEKRTSEPEPIIKYSPSAIDNSELPSRYKRKAPTLDEIEYINRGGPD